MEAARLQQPCARSHEKSRNIYVQILPNASMPRRERQLLVFVCVVDGGLQVYGDGVISRDFGGNVDGLHGEHGVAAGSKVRRMR